MPYHTSRRAMSRCAARYEAWLVKHRGARVGEFDDGAIRYCVEEAKEGYLMWCEARSGVRGRSDLLDAYLPSQQICQAKSLNQIFGSRELQGRRPRGGRHAGSVRSEF